MHTNLFVFSLSICIISARAETPRDEGDNHAAKASALSLDMVTNTVIENNPTIMEARAKWEAMRQRVPQAAAWEDLKISAGSRAGRFVSVQPNSFGDQMLSIEQMIPISGKNKSRARIAAAEALMLAEEIRRKEFDVLSKARVSFSKLANAYVLLDLNNADETSLKQTVESTRAKFETGGASQADVLTSENELTKIHEARQDLMQSLSEEETKLCVLMNRDPFKPLGKPQGQYFDSSQVSTERLRALILSRRPEVRIAENGVTLAKAKLELAQREWIPDPALSVQAQRYNGAGQAVSEVGVGISVTLPWLNGKKYRAEEKEAASGVEAAQKAVEAARIEALGMLRDQLRKIETAHHHLELYRDNLMTTAAQAVEANRAGFETGKTGLLEMLTSLRNLRELRSMFQQHLSAYQSAVAELEAIVGTDARNFFQPVENTQRSKK